MSDELKKPGYLLMIILQSFVALLFFCVGLFSCRTQQELEDALDDFPTTFNDCKVYIKYASKDDISGAVNTLEITSRVKQISILNRKIITTDHHVIPIDCILEFKRIKE